MYLRSTGRNFLQIFIKLGTNNSFCNPSEKCVGQKNPTFLTLVFVEKWGMALRIFFNFSLVSTIWYKVGFTKLFSTVSHYFLGSVFILWKAGFGWEQQHVHVPRSLWIFIICFVNIYHIAFMIQTCSNFVLGMAVNKSVKN